jgi:RNA polymerase sigma-70 factor (ECF subfamily)
MKAHNSVTVAHPGSQPIIFEKNKNNLNKMDSSLYNRQISESGQVVNSEIEAISACQAGKKEAYKYLVEKYKTRAFYAALLYTKNRDDALDLSQDAFIKAFRAINTFDISRNFYTWFYKILKNVCLNYVQFKKVRAQTSDGLDETILTPANNQVERPDEIFEKSEESDLLWKAIDDLNEKDREIIILKEFNEMSYQEIADILDIPIGSVMSRLYYARKKLLKKLECLNG